MNPFSLVRHDNLAFSRESIPQQEIIPIVPISFTKCALKTLKVLIKSTGEVPEILLKIL
jgi:hypothetical protein